MFSFATHSRSRVVRALAVTAGGVLMTGAVMSGTSMAETTAPEQDPVQAMAEACQEGYLCVWDEALGQGNRHDYLVCEDVDVRHVGLARVGSFVNNQTDGTVATFKGPNADTPDGPWSDQYTSTAFEIRDNDQGSLTFGVRVC